MKIQLKTTESEATNTVKLMKMLSKDLEKI